MERLSGASLQGLTAKLDWGDATVRREIAFELGKRGRAGDRRVIPLLVSQLNDAGSYVDEAASDELWSIGKPAVPALIEVLRTTSESLGTRLWAARTFSYLRDSRAFACMIDIMQDTNEDETLRTVVALHLGQTKDALALNPLTTVLLDPRTPAVLRARAASALGDLGDARAVPSLLEVLNRDDVQFHPPGSERDLRRLHEMLDTVSEQDRSNVEGILLLAQKGRSLHWVASEALRSLGYPQATSL